VIIANLKDDLILAYNFSNEKTYSLNFGTKILILIISMKAIGPVVPGVPLNG
jgi:hypothetical protein